MKSLVLRRFLRGKHLTEFRIAAYIYATTNDQTRLQVAFRYNFKKLG
jgi:hypothetical protein